MGRQIALIFFGKPRDAHAEHAHESGSVMRLAAASHLALGTIIGGAITLTRAALA